MGDDIGGEFHIRRLYVVRHGQSDKNTLPKWRPLTAKQYDRYLRAQVESPLTPKGTKQVTRSAKWLEGVLPRPACIYASTAKRTRETAKLIGKQLGIQMESSKELREVHARSFPRWLPPLPLRIYIVLDRLALFIPWPREETWYSGLLRARNDLRQIAGGLSSSHEQSAIIVSHHLLIRLMILYARISPGWRVTKHDVSTAGVSVIERR